MPGDAPRPRCPGCGGELRFSHRNYAGRGASAEVRRCVACGQTVVGAARSDAERPRDRRGPRKPPVDEGPPPNPVIDPELARRLREQFGDAE